MFKTIEIFRRVFEKYLGCVPPITAPTTIKTFKYDMMHPKAQAAFLFITRWSCCIDDV